MPVSVSGEFGIALAEERLDALARILALEAGELRRGLEVERLAERAPLARVDALLDRPKRHRRPPREQFDELSRLGGEVVVRHDAVDEADAEGLVRAEDLAGHHE